VRQDAIIATGRSDYPNQVNNVLGFPFIFRGALDVRARKINEPMKQAAVMALAELALRGEAVPRIVRDAYPNDVFDFGSSYIIPKPFDPRIFIYVPLAVAQAAMESGVARTKVDLVEYRKHLEERVGDLAGL
jgi:malate dehydrogenase (oxaloacetate-decarboxylating)(NADP+)